MDSKRYFFNISLQCYSSLLAEGECQGEQASASTKKYYIRLTLTLFENIQPSWLNKLGQ